MPVYQYKDKFYDLADTDPFIAKAKILRHLGESQIPQRSQPVAPPEPDMGAADPFMTGIASAISAEPGAVAQPRPAGYQSVLEKYNIEQAGKPIPFTPEEGAALSNLKNIQRTQAQVAQGREIQARQQAARQAQRQAAKEEDYGITDFFKDTGIDVSKGVVGLGEAYVGLLNLTSGGAAGRVLGDLGYDPERTKKFLTGFQSLSRQEADRSVQEAEGFINTLSALGVNPTALVGTVAESLPGTVLSGAVGGKFVRFLAGKAANEATSLGLTGAAAEKFIADRIKEQSFKIAAVASGAEGFQSAGAIAEAARQGGREWSDYILPSLGAGFGTAAIGAVGGKAAAKMGIGDIETSIATRSAGIKGVTPAEGPAFTRILKEAAKEGVFEEMPQSAQEQVFQNLALGKPWDEGVDKAAAMGLVAGLAMGGGNASVVAALRGGASSEDVKAVPPAAPPAAPPVAEVAPPVVPPVAPPAAEAPAPEAPPVVPPRPGVESMQEQQRAAEELERAAEAPPEVAPPVAEAAPVAEAPVEEPAAAPPVAPAEPRGLFAPPQSELPPLPSAEPVTAKEPLPDIVVPAGFKAKEGRTPQLVFAARALAEGKITKDQYDEYVERYKPITEVIGDKLETPIEDALMTRILTQEIRDKKKPELVNAPIADGTRVGLRMDIPALDWGRENGVNGSVVSIHKGESPKRKTQGENISYKSTGRIKNVVFAPRSEEDAFKIAQQAEPEVKTKKTGEKYLKKVADKKPQQTMEGEWVNTSPEETMRLVRENLNDPNWVQVSLDPLRHSYFYARDSKRPVLSADEALQVGRFVLVKNPVYGDRQQFLYNIESILDAPVGGDPDQRSQSYKREAKKLTKAYEDGRISSEQFAGQMGILKRQDDQQRAQKEKPPLVRGAYQIKEQLNEAARKGWISEDAYQLAEWFINSNPRLVEDLAISLQGKGQRGVVGTYDVFNRLMILIKNKGNDNTIVHEILHHLERMMPQEVQDSIRKEWTKRLLNAQKQAKTELEKFFFDALIDHHFGENRIGDLDLAPKMIAELNKMGFDFNLDTPSSKVVKEMLKRGTVPIANYQYYSPSEFWAVNGSDIVRGRYNAIKGGVLTRLKNWLRELGQKIKSIFGLSSDAPILRALDSLAKADGQFVTDDLLDQAQTLFSVKPNKKQTDTPEFKRWFGESKVVDENGDPLVVYHSGSFSETEDREFQTEGGVHFGTKRAALDRSVGKAIDDEVKSAEIYEEGGRYYFDENDYPNAPSNGFRTDGDARAWLAGEVNEYYQPGDYEPNLTAAYLSIKNPKRVKDQGENWAAAIAEAKAEGHDGIVYRNEYEDKGKDSYIAFDPTQIKSATGNIGTFDPNDPNILYSIDPTEQAPSEGGAVAPTSRVGKNIYNRRPIAEWTTPTDTKLDDFIYRIQDKLIDTKRVIQEIEAAASRLEDRWDPYLQEELYHGRTATATKDFLRFEVRPLLEAMKKEGVTIDELDTYLHNRFAPIRNENIANINPNMPDAGSGILTEDAKAYMDALTLEQKAKYERLAAKVDAITQGTRGYLVGSGQESQETINAWEKSSPFYVPLNREDVEYTSSGGMGTGRGFSVSGPTSKRATGSLREVSDILANIIMQRERAIVRGEKNRVGVALYGLAVQNPNPDLWLAVNPDATKSKEQLINELIGMGLTKEDAEGLMQEPRRQGLDPQTGLVVSRINIPDRYKDNVLGLRINGKDRFIFFNSRNPRAERMVTALKNLDADQLGTVMSKIAMVTRYFSQINTQYNPVFGIYNFLRDIQGGAIQLSGTDIEDRRAEVLSPKNIAGALNGIYSTLRAERADNPQLMTPWSELWIEFQREGGQTGYRDMFSRSQERAQALKDELDRLQESGGRKAAFAVPRAIRDWLSDYNETLENAVRLTAYKAALDKGLSKQRAASIAKNLTVNFNRKGQLGNQVGALYSFFNSGVQGTTRLLETVAKLEKPGDIKSLHLSKIGKKIIYGGLLLGSVQAMLLAAFDFDENEPPDFVKDKNLIIPIGEGKYLAWPYPLGYHVIPAISRIITEWGISGFKDTPKRVAHLADLLLDAFNPIGNAGWSFQTIAPTIFDPLAALFENKDWTGKKIAKEDFNKLDPTPGYTRAKENASWVGKELSYYLNLISGGDKDKPGEFSPTPDQIDYLIGQVTGGLGREVMKGVKTAEATITGEELPPYNIPLIGRFYGNTKAGYAESQRFYKNLQELNILENQLEGRTKRKEDPAQFRKDNPKVALADDAQRTYKLIREIRKERDELIKQGADKEKIQAKEQRMINLMRRINNKVAAYDKGKPPQKEEEATP